MKKTLLTVSLFVSSCFFALAQVSLGTTATTVTGANNALLKLLALAQTIVTRSIPLLVGVAVLSFFWFLITFIIKGKDSPDEQQKSLRGMGLSILALFVMVSIWGIIGFFGSIFGIGQGGTMAPFKLPGEQ